MTRPEARRKELQGLGLRKLPVWTRAGQHAAVGPVCLSCWQGLFEEPVVMSLALEFRGRARVEGRAGDAPSSSTAVVVPAFSGWHGLSHI